MSVPTGTVTFLFTDIEGSTRLWEDYPEPMSRMTALHETLIRDACERSGGHVFKTVGDGVLAAFETAPDALATALMAQQSLITQAWETPRPIRVRMALHTGTVERRDGDYYGQVLNRAARLLAIGHGGQTLLSDVVQRLVLDLLPESVTLLNLGEHRLKDLERPEQVYQLCHPTLDNDFAPLRSLDSPHLPNNLPVQMTSFIGREKELRETVSFLDKARLLTITGAGGVGKTRLSLQIAAEVLNDYPGGAWFVELAPLTDAERVMGAVAEVLRIKDVPGEPLWKTIADALPPKRTLILLDNCEHVLNTCAKLCDSLLKACPNLRIIASSREALGVSGEQTYRIPSLAVPDLKQAWTVHSLSQYDAARLFIERALLVRADFAVTNANAPALAQICHRLDGIPLAIELAAARVKSLTLEEINTRLDHRFRLLTGGNRTALPRQQTLRSLIDWSYDLLTDSEKRLLNRLAVFAGGWTLEAAEVVCSGNGLEAGEILDRLAGLVEKSLVLTEEQGDHTRYRLSETVRQYGRERLTESADSENETIGNQYRAYFVALAKEAEPHLDRPEQATWLNCLEQEHDNLRSVLSLASTEERLALVSVVWRYWMARGHFSEGRRWLDSALESSTGQLSMERAKALTGAGVLAFHQSDFNIARSRTEDSLAVYRTLDYKPGIAGATGNLGSYLSSQGEYAAARAMYDESLSLSRELGNGAYIASLLSNIGIVSFYRGDYAEARSFYEEGLALQRKFGNQRVIAASLSNLGMIAQLQGDYAVALQYRHEGLSLARDLGDRRMIANALINIGDTVLLQGDTESARDLYEESLTTQREIGNRQGIATCLNGLGNVALEQKEYPLAQSLYREGLSLQRELGDKHAVTVSIESFAALASVRGDAEHAAKLWGALHGLRDSLGAVRSPDERSNREQLITSVRHALGESAYESAFAQGKELSWETAITVAIAGVRDTE